MLYRVLLDNTPHPTMDKILSKGTVIDLFHQVGNPLTVGAAAVLEKIDRGGSVVEENRLETIIHREINNKLPELLNDNTGLASVMVTVVTTNEVIGDTVEEITIEVMNNSNEKAFFVKVFFDLSELLIQDVSESAKIIDTTACWTREILPVGGKINIIIKVKSFSETEQDVIRAVTVEGFNIAPGMASVDLHLNEKTIEDEVQS